MMKIIKLAVAAFALFLFLTEGIPWIRGRVEGITQDKVIGRPDPLAGDASTCVHLATQATAVVGDEIHGAKPPPGDSSGWVEASDSIRQRISEAEDACTCPGAGCETARRAMEELRHLVSEVDMLISGQAPGFGSLGNRQENINVLLEQARVEAR